MSKYWILVCVKFRSKLLVFVLNNLILKQYYWANQYQKKEKYVKSFIIPRNRSINTIFVIETDDRLFLDSLSSTTMADKKVALVLLV